jgi:hypothetical protein
MRVIRVLGIIPDSPVDPAIVRNGDMQKSVSAGDFDAIHRRRWLRWTFGVRVRLLFMGGGLLLDGL